MLRQAVLISKREGFVIKSAQCSEKTLTLWKKGDFGNGLNERHQNLIKANYTIIKTACLN